MEDVDTTDVASHDPVDDVQLEDEAAPETEESTDSFQEWLDTDDQEVYEDAFGLTDGLDGPAQEEVAALAQQLSDAVDQRIVEALWPLVELDQQQNESVNAEQVVEYLLDEWKLGVELDPEAVYDVAEEHLPAFTDAYGETQEAGVRALRLAAELQVAKSSAKDELDLVRRTHGVYSRRSPEQKAKTRPANKGPKTELDVVREQLDRVLP